MGMSAQVSGEVRVLACISVGAYSALDDRCVELAATDGLDRL